MLDSYFHPYSQSLITAIVSCVAAALYKPICAWLGFVYTKSAALIIGTAVFSHWVLDLVAHPPDLAIYGDKWKVGLGLWKHRDPEFALEIALLAAGVTLYLTRNVMPAIRKRVLIVFGLFLVVIQIGNTYVARNALTDKQTALGVWSFYTLFGLIAFALEKIGSRRCPGAPPVANAE
jgi:hypothetical protein